jgi:hypothetical protein
MNVMTLMALSMNPNVTPEFIAERIRESGERQKRAMDELRAACEKDPEHALELMNACMPFILEI